MLRIVVVGLVYLLASILAIALIWLVFSFMACIGLSLLLVAGWTPSPSELIIASLEWGAILAVVGTIFSYLEQRRNDA